MEQKGNPSSNIYYSEFQSGVLGKIWLAATDLGLKYLRFDDDAAEFIAKIAKSIEHEQQPNILYSPEKLSPYQTAIQNYCQDKTPIPLSLTLDVSELTDFQQEILQYVREIPFGASTTYGEIAEAIENPNASRAIGQVLRRNPIPIIIPCHRVLSADGTLGGYGGVMGSKRKIALLKHEGVILA
ncbi:MAG: MGMT family protein [Anaerolineales bacterium]|jgi:methylated-DNA-[protein]-cysteine S-methyltransferase